MACFVVSVAGALAVGAAKYIVKHHENKVSKETTDFTKIEDKKYKFGSETKWSKKLGILELSLLGGSFLLAGEHILHGEVVPYFPFLTAASEAESASEMLYEMGTIGVTMMLAITAAWAIGIFLFDLFKYRKHKKAMLEEKK